MALDTCETVLQIGPCILQKLTYNPKSMRHGYFTNKPLNFTKINSQSNDYCTCYIANKPLGFYTINLQSIFKRKFFLTHPERFKIFTIQSRLHKNLFQIILKFI
jgi:hypothetical protein